MKLLSDSYRLLNILSIDVALGATVSGIFFTEIFKVKATLQDFLCLGLAVWIIYTTDHLLDVRQMKQKASTVRHQFHQKYYHVLLRITGFLSVSLLILILFLTKQTLIWGGGLGLLVIVYLFFQRKLGFTKELVGAFLYSSGVVLPALAIYDHPYSVKNSVPVILFFSIALTNLILFSWFDKERDLIHNHSSIATRVGASKTKMALYFLFVLLSALLTLLYFQHTDPWPIVIFTLMTLTLLIIFLLSVWFSIEDRYRLAGDAIFLIPVIYLSA